MRCWYTFQTPTNRYTIKTIFQRSPLSVIKRHKLSECECWMNIKWTENHLICRCMLKIIHGWQFQGWWDLFLWAHFLDSSSETFTRHLPQDGGSNLWCANGYNKLNPDKALNRRQHRTSHVDEAMEFSSHQITGIMSLVYISLKIKMLNYPYVTLRLIISSSETFRLVSSGGWWWWSSFATQCRDEHEDFSMVV